MVAMLGVFNAKTKNMAWIFFDMIFNHMVAQWSIKSLAFSCQSKL